MTIDITSTSNPKIKILCELISKPRKRDELQQFTVEGVREVTHCLEGGYEPVTVFWTPDIAGGAAQELFNSDSRLPKIAFTVSQKVYEKIAYRGSTEGVMAVFRKKANDLAPLEARLREIIAAGREPLVLVAEGIEKPGNIGALTRTAASCGVDGLLLCDCNTDIYNANAIRAGLGGIFLLQTAVCSSDEAIAMLKRLKINILTAQLQDSEPYYATDMTTRCAIVVGSEADGLTAAWRENSDKKILIPMLGRLDSLNVSVSAAILCYEALRQRTTTPRRPTSL